MASYHKVAIGSPPWMANYFILIQQYYFNCQFFILFFYKFYLSNLMWSTSISPLC